MDQCGIYTIVCGPTGASYIGSSVNIRNRWKWHLWALRNGKHHSTYLQRSWDKHGKEAFEMRVLETCSREELRKQEQFYLDAFRPVFNSCLIAGSCSEKPLTEQHRQRISQSKKGKVFTAEHRANISAARRSSDRVRELATARRGVPRSTEVVAKITTANRRPRKRGGPHSLATREKIRSSALLVDRTWLIGHEVSEETRSKISEGKRGRSRIDLRGVPRTPEVKEKISIAQRGKPRPWLVGRIVSDETRAKISATKRAAYLAKLGSVETL